MATPKAKSREVIKMYSYFIEFENGDILSHNSFNTEEECIKEMNKARKINYIQNGKKCIHWWIKKI